MQIFLGRKYDKQLSVIDVPLKMCLLGTELREKRYVLIKGNDNSFHLWVFTMCQALCYTIYMCNLILCL